MNRELQENLFEVSPLLYKHFKGNPKVQIDCPDDLFEFIIAAENVRKFPADLRVILVCKTNLLPGLILLKNISCKLKIC